MQYLWNSLASACGQITLTWLTYRNVTSHKLHSQGVHGNPISNSHLWLHHAQKGFSKNIYNVLSVLNLWASARL